MLQQESTNAILKNSSLQSNKLVHPDTFSEKASASIGLYNKEHEWIKAWTVLRALLRQLFAVKQKQQAS